jgi:hypothetical protein
VATQEGNWRGWIVLLVTLLLVGLLGAAGVARGIPYGGDAKTPTSAITGNCLPSEQECILMGMTCVDYDASGSCMTACAAACYPLCALGGWVWGLSCTLGCSTICWEGCKYCEEWEYYWYCYCPGQPVPEISLPPMPLEE